MLGCRSLAVEPGGDAVVRQLRLIADPGAIDIRGFDRSVRRDRHFDDEADPVLVFAEGSQIGRQFFGQHREDLRRRVHRGRVALRVIVDGRAGFDEGVDIGDGHEDFYIPVRERLANRELIEDFMIAANGVVAEFLATKGFPVLRRVLAVPERWPRIVVLAKGLGADLPAKADAAALNDFLMQRRANDPVGFPDLSLAVVKLLGSGEYVLQKPGQQVAGHFGLAVTDYTHSTAPNRRFPDLITQRLIKAALNGGKSPYSDDDLARLANHCTIQEDNAAKVERLVRKSAAALLLGPRVGQTFDAIVTGAGDKGTWVRTCEPAAEGKVVKGFDGLDVGDRVRVQLIHTDVQRGFIDFARAH